MQVLKIGGNELADAAFRRDFAGAVASLTGDVVIVHGGGRSVAKMQQRLGLQPVMVDGLRVTDADSLEVAQMVLSGHTNKLLVADLLAAGVPAVGFSGVDNGLLRCKKKEHARIDLGYVGQIVGVNAAFLKLLHGQNVTPVISPISLGMDGQIYNVNADEAAAAIGAALGVDTVSFISNVAAVLDESGRAIPELDWREAERLIAQGVIREGMVPKVRAALEVVKGGVPEARILNLSGLQGVGGTRFTASSPQDVSDEEVAHSVAGKEKS
jgi:acetylglutamate kinase